jgi:hypothetical protein
MNNEKKGKKRGKFKLQYFQRNVWTLMIYDVSFIDFWLTSIDAKGTDVGPNKRIVK